MKNLLLKPEDVQELLNVRFRRQRKQWLQGSGNWPISISLKVPKESDVVQIIDQLNEWEKAWQAWSDQDLQGTLTFKTFAWKHMGKRRLPTHVTFKDAIEVAACTTNLEYWQAANTAYQALTTRWPQLSPELSRHFDLLSNPSLATVEKLTRVLAWLEDNPASGLHLRQFPIKGVDSKWIENHYSLVTSLFSVITGNTRENSPLGERALPGRIRIRVLDPSLRQFTSGLSDIEAPIVELADLSWQVKNVWIVENLQTALSFADLESTVVIMKLGYNVSPLKELAWVHKAKCFYWGDLDADGFNILNSARGFVEELESVLMTTEVFEKFRSLSEKQHSPPSYADLTRLTELERKTYDYLVELGFQRLEQERIDWDFAWTEILRHHCTV